MDTYWIPIYVGYHTGCTKNVIDQSPQSAMNTRQTHKQSVLWLITLFIDHFFCLFTTSPLLDAIPNQICINLSPYNDRLLFQCSSTSKTTCPHHCFFHCHQCLFCLHCYHKQQSILGSCWSTQICLPRAYIPNACC